MTKAEIQQNNDELRNKLAAYEALGSPEQIKEKISRLTSQKGALETVANKAEAVLDTFRKLLA